jgi:hypothetical protein
MVVVVVFPLLELFGVEVRVVDDFTFEGLVVTFRKLMRWDFSTVLLGCGVLGVGLDVVDVFVEEVSVEHVSEFLTVVGLDLLNLEWQF